ncbi:EAL domain-containing protein [Siccirubricoccus sp. KC 17139]|uniref:EAL domain-containing protein n=1 Tax=Siccirubricoccus soli TaxID=2899147 RepID=A0ABT1D9A7_9PROT|nr:EAL domain-containing protein [Siccirubricoccus soli]MCO6418526.1 EAL domain-containing protein [Siccirubricoccus soli]MCP2684661.1 EAL domain-containing protein [Siccirubricoccus soli]
MESEEGEPPHRPRPVTDRERFLTFALAAAEMLLEVSSAGRILFAAGAFQSRLGRSPDSLVGAHVREVLALPDHAAFEIAFNILLSRDRLPPTLFHLANAGATAMACSGLRLLGRDADRLCLTFAALPLAGAAEGPRIGGPAPLRDAANALARGVAPAGTLGLLEIHAPEGSLAPDGELTRLVREELATSIAPDSLAGELAAGRFGVISRTRADLAAVGAKIEALARASGLAASVATEALALDDASLTPMQMTRALRYALSVFGRGGAAALAEAGFDGGLAGFVAGACARTVRLRQAIAERKFRLAFQPIVRLADRRPHHYEALLRPEADIEAPLVMAQDFVIFAEALGLSEELDWAVLLAVCSAARRSGGPRIAANLSGLSLQSPGFRAALVKLLESEPLLARRLLFEITETAEIEEEAEAVRTVEALRGLGVPLCIDDFGAGAAAFRYLRTLRVDYVKIDGLYVQNAMRSPVDRGIVASMVDLARTVGAQVVAEWVETEAEAALMQELGVEFGQGWLFGRPGPLPG